MLLYLHGFRSSPESFKAKLIGSRLRETGHAQSFSCPQLPVSPELAIAQIQAQFEIQSSDTIVGSSLGGFYATWLAEQTGCSAVLLNPAITPHIGLADYVGQLRTFHDDRPMVFERSYLDELRRLRVETITRPDRYFLIAAKGDELLDWREMVAHYPRANSIVIDASDHGISDFEDYLDPVLEFAGFGRPVQ